MFKILNTNSDMWNYYLKKMPMEKQDIYYTSEYYEALEKKGDGKATLFVYEENENIAIYAFMLNEISSYKLDKKYYDIETAYGYGGPILNCNEDNFKKQFECCFLDFCKNNNIVAEFIRFHPLIKNENLFSSNIEILHNRTTVSLNISKEIEKIWVEDISSKNRNMIRKAEKSGLCIEQSIDFNLFKNLYNYTMNKLGATNFYYFNDLYYKSVKEIENISLLNVKKDNIVIAAAIFMGYGDYFHFHLSGSLTEYLKYAPNNFLLWESIKYAHNKGYKKMHFGGGITGDSEDNLYKFKSSFSREHSDFYIGKRVHNEGIYNYLISQWEKVNKKKPDVFLQYKY